MMTVKKYSLGLQNLVMSAHQKIESSQHASVESVNAVTREREFLTTDHVRAVREKRSEGQKARDAANEINLAETV